MKKDHLWILLFLSGTFVVMMIGINVGAAKTSVWNLWTGSDADHMVLWELRIPRLLLAWETGALLAVAGSIMQRVLNNPLADPYILGSAAGATLGAALVRLLMGSSLFLLPSLGAFAGAVMSMLLLLLLSKFIGSSGRSQVILAGVAISSFIMASLSFIYYLSIGDHILKELIFWSFGSFELADWKGIGLLAPLILLSLMLQPLWYKQLSLMLLGDVKAAQLGLQPENFRWKALLFSSVLVACCVAQAGPIGFVGLMVPHWVRSIWGMHRLSVVWEILLGGFLLLFAEVVGKLLVYPAGLPPGIMTSILGVPFFVYLLVRKKYNFQ